MELELIFYNQNENIFAGFFLKPLNYGIHSALFNVLWLIFISNSVFTKIKDIAKVY